MKFFKNKKGFTLVELVVVIAILGILAGIAIPRFMDATATARGAKIVADMRTVESAETMYYVQNNGYGTMTQLTTAGFLAAKPVPPTGSYIVTDSGRTGTVAASTEYEIAIVAASGGTPASYTITLGASGPTLATLTTKSGS